MRGGYKILDVSGIDIHSETSVTIKGIYSKIESNYGKPMLLHGLMHNDIDMEDIWVNMLPVPSLYLGTFLIREGSNTIQIIFSINSDDLVSVTRVTIGG